MSHHSPHTNKVQDTRQEATLLSYSTGFTASIIMTVAAFLLVTERILSGNFLVAALLFLAVIQLIIQLQFFLHLGQESKPRWKFMVFLFMLLVLLIIVVGSLWIMNNLSYHNMTPGETEQYIEHEEAIHR